MTVSPSPDLTKLGRGSLYFDRYISGVRTGFLHLGNCDNFGLGTSTEKLTMKDYTQQTSANYNEVVTSTDNTIAISGFEFSSLAMQIAYMGDATTYSQSASSATGEVIALAALTELEGRSFRTAKKSISSVVVKQGATTYTVTDDYTVDATRGIITVVEGGAITPGIDLTVDYSYAAVTNQQVIRGGTVSAIEGFLYFRANNSTGPNDDVEVFRASLTPNGETGFISDEFGKWTVEGKCLSDAIGTYGGSASNPYFQVVRY